MRENTLHSMLHRIIGVIMDHPAFREQSRFSTAPTVCAKWRARIFCKLYQSSFFLVACVTAAFVASLSGRSDCTIWVLG